MEIDLEFSNVDEWKLWASQNIYVFDRDFAVNLANKIHANGFVEPITKLHCEANCAKLKEKNLRESLTCNGSNSRTRAVMKILSEFRDIYGANKLRIYGAEALTPLALKLRGIFPRYIGSEYADDDASKKRIYPIEHQDLMSLNFPSEVFDIVTTNEVLEHVPDIDQCLSEMARVLKNGGWHIGTFPFLAKESLSRRRAQLVNGQLVHLINPPQYHGNPMSKDGSLVFELPAWDIIDRARSAGFASAHMRFIASEKHGIVTDNTGVFVFCARK